MKCFYVGQTNDFSARMQEHYDNVRSRDTSTYTGRFDFVKPVWKKRVSTRSEALKLERHVKSLSHDQKRSLISGNLSL